MANMIFLNIAVCTIFYGAQGYFFAKAKNLGREIGLAPDHVFFQFISEQQNSMNIVFVVTAILVTLLIVMFGLIYSNRIAGPLYHLEKYLRQRIAGEQNGDVKFREHDNFPEIATVVNDYIHSRKH